MATAVRTMSDYWFSDSILNDDFKPSLMSPSADLAAAGAGPEANPFAAAMGQAINGGTHRLPWAAGTGGLASPGPLSALSFDALRPAQLGVSPVQTTGNAAQAADGMGSAMSTDGDGVPSADRKAALPPLRIKTEAAALNNTRSDDGSDVGDSPPGSRLGYTELQTVPSITVQHDLQGSHAGPYVPGTIRTRSLAPLLYDGDLAVGLDHTVGMSVLHLSSSGEFHATSSSEDDDESTTSHASLHGPTHHLMPPPQPAGAAGSSAASRAAQSRAGKADGGRSTATSRSPDEVQTLASRRQERNRVAARRSREKKKEYVQELEATAHALVIKNKELLRDIRRLRKELAELKGIPYDGPEEAPPKPAINRRGIPMRSAAAAASPTAAVAATGALGTAARSYRA